MGTVASRQRSSASAGDGDEIITLDKPAPGSPFHYAFPVHCLDRAKHFYGDVLGCKEGRSSEKWQDYSLHGPTSEDDSRGRRRTPLGPTAEADSPLIPSAHHAWTRSEDHFVRWMRAPPSSLRWQPP